MTVVQVKKKAQITIPKKIREKLGIKEGDILEVEAEKEALLFRPRLSSRVFPRPASALSFKKLAKIVSVGGDALKDSEKVYEK